MKAYESLAMVQSITYDPHPPPHDQGMGSIGLPEVLLFLGLPLLIVFALGYFAGKNRGMKEGLREARRPPAS